MKEIMHDSDCAVYNEPAYPAGPCDCGAEARAKRQYVKMIYQMANSRAKRCKNIVRLKILHSFLKARNSSTRAIYLNLFCLLFGRHERQDFLRWSVRVRRIQRLYPDSDS